MRTVFLIYNIILRLVHLYYQVKLIFLMLFCGQKYHNKAVTFL